MVTLVSNYASHSPHHSSSIPLFCFHFSVRIFVDEASNIAFGQSNQSIEHSAAASAHETVGKTVAQVYRWLEGLAVADDPDYGLAGYHKLRRLQNAQQRLWEPNEKAARQELHKGR